MTEGEKPRAFLTKQGIRALLESLQGLKYGDYHSAVVDRLTAPTNQYIDLLVHDINGLLADREPRVLYKHEFEELRTQLSGHQLAPLLALPEDQPYHSYVEAARAFKKEPDSLYYTFLQDKKVIDTENNLDVVWYSVSKAGFDKQFEKAMAVKDKNINPDAEISAFFHNLEVDYALHIASAAQGAFDRVMHGQSRAGGIAY